MLLQDVRRDRGLAREVVTVRFLATILFRMAQRAGRIHPLLGYAVKQLNHLLSGADLAWQASVGPGVRLFHPTGVVWGPGVVVGANCTIQQGVTLGTKSIDDDVRGASPRIGSDVQLGSGCKVIGGVDVGDRCVIGANAVVTRNIAPNSVAVGVPARVIGKAHFSEGDSSQ